MQGKVHQPTEYLLTTKNSRRIGTKQFLNSQQLNSFMRYAPEHPFPCISIRRRIDSIPGELDAVLFFLLPLSHKCESVYNSITVACYFLPHRRSHLIFSPDSVESFLHIAHLSGGKIQRITLA